MPKIIKPSSEEEFTYEKPTSFPGQSPVVAEASKLGQELKSISLEGVGDEYPTSDAMDRSEVYQLGGMIEPPTVPSITPPAYKKGGKVKKY